MNPPRSPQFSCRKKLVTLAVTGALAFGFGMAASPLHADLDVGDELDLLSLSDSFDETASNNSTSYVDAGTTGAWNVDLSTELYDITFVPEPSRALLQFFGVAFILFRRRRSL
jgi:hypothetical protein